MKTIGIIGGLGPEATAVYYKALNEGVRARTGNRHQAIIVIYSVDGGAIWTARQREDWDAQGVMLADAARGLERAGADVILLASNTSHRCAPAIEAAICVPFLHLIETTARAVAATGIRRIGLTGTSYTMTGSHYTGVLEAHGLTPIVPDESGIATLNRIIYDELVWGRILDTSRRDYEAVTAGLAARGAEGVILGCTELTLFEPMTCPVPRFDSTRIHVDAALDFAL